MWDIREVYARPLVILEMANNHNGSVEHALQIVREMKEAVEPFEHVFRFAMKLQYRDVERAIHPAYLGRVDLKYVKRFTETRLSWDEYKRVKDAIDEAGFLSVCTPWDEGSVEKIVEHGFEVMKVPSCYFNDWPLLRKVAKTEMPIIASVAGARLEEIDKVVAFFGNRGKQFGLMHCNAIYPTPHEKMELGQIALLKARYPGVPVGYSTHESAGATLSAMAIALGARMLEKHVGVQDYPEGLNSYSVTPHQLYLWLLELDRVYAVLGHTEERHIHQEEVETLGQLQRGVWATETIEEGARVEEGKVMLAMPAQSGQMRANELGKYMEHVAIKRIEAGARIMREGVKSVDRRAQLLSIVKRSIDSLEGAGVIVPELLELEVSHHYGLERFEEWGSVGFTVINTEEYCKRIIVMRPWQSHPEQWHEKKSETYHVLSGRIALYIEGDGRTVAQNQIVQIPAGKKHKFSAYPEGAVIEEVSSRYDPNDSHYTDLRIEANKNRKTRIVHWVGAKGER